LPLAWADAELIERVLQNLIDNAIKFTPTGGVVRVTAKVDTGPPPRVGKELGERAEEHPRLLVSVSDTGSGIPPEIQGQLFKKFITGAQEGRGNGLGLAFCKMVIEAHGGRIWVERTSESGTTFTFTLPLAPASVA
jgi:signal transduction histidine kinase